MIRKEVTHTLVNVILEMFSDEWQARLNGDMECGTHWNNNEAHREFSRKYPEISGMGDVIQAIRKQFENPFSINLCEELCQNVFNSGFASGAESKVPQDCDPELFQELVNAIGKRFFVKDTPDDSATEITMSIGLMRKVARHIEKGDCQ